MVEGEEINIKIRVWQVGYLAHEKAQRGGEGKRRVWQGRVEKFRRVRDGVVS